MRHELTDEEWTAIRPMLPNKARGVPKAVLTVPKTDFRSSLNNGHQTSGRPLLKSANSCHPGQAAQRSQQMGALNRKLRGGSKGASFAEL